MLECQRLQPKPNDERIKVQVFTNIHPKKNDACELSEKIPEKRSEQTDSIIIITKKRAKGKLHTRAHTRAKKPDQNHSVPKTEPSKAN